MKTACYAANFGINIFRCCFYTPPIYIAIYQTIHLPLSDYSSCNTRTSGNIDIF